MKFDWEQISRFACGFIFIAATLIWMKITDYQIEQLTNRIRVLERIEGIYVADKTA